MIIPLLLKIAAGIAVSILVKKIFFGKKVAFIGMKGAGKTTAIEAFIAVDEKKEDWKPSNSPGTTEKKDIRVKFFDSSSCIDTCGSQSLKKQWEKIIKSADAVLYFYDISMWNDIRMVHDGISEQKHRYGKMVGADLKQIAEICKGRKKKVFILATHTDKIDSDFLSKVNAEIDDMVGDIENCKRVSGSLVDYNNAKEFYESIEEKLK